MKQELCYVLSNQNKYEKTVSMLQISTKGAQKFIFDIS
jgi:hypothetical protein